MLTAAAPQQHGVDEHVFILPKLAQRSAELCGGDLRIPPPQVTLAHGREQRGSARRAIDFEARRAAVCQCVDQPGQSSSSTPVQPRAEERADTAQLGVRVCSVALQPLTGVEKVLAWGSSYRQPGWLQQLIAQLPGLAKQRERVRRWRNREQEAAAPAPAVTAHDVDGRSEVRRWHQ